MDEPRLPLTVTLELWQAMATAVRGTFADSYLSGANLIGRRLLPWTLTAYERLHENEWAMKCLEDQGIILVEPLPFGHPERPENQRLAAG